ncbi:hypothetical protein ACIFQM_01185 [Paenibacillus sp. NRS-1782]
MAIEAKKVPAGKPKGMSDSAWIKLHEVVAKIHVNHAKARNRNEKGETA